MSKNWADIQFHGFHFVSLAFVNRVQHQKVAYTKITFLLYQFIHMLRALIKIGKIFYKICYLIVNRHCFVQPNHGQTKMIIRVHSSFCNLKLNWKLYLIPRMMHYLVHSYSLDRIYSQHSVYQVSA